MSEKQTPEDMLRHYLINEIKRIRELRNKLKEEYPELMK